MNKKQFLAMALCMLGFSTSGLLNAQSVKGVNYLNAGIGVGTIGFAGTGGTPIAVSFEHGVSDKISVGASVAFVSTSYASNVRYSYYVIGARGSYHFNEALKVNDPKWDLYGGASIFYRGYSIKYTNSINTGLSSAGTIGVGIHAAAHYYFAPKVGAFAEVGFGISALQLGITFKF